MRLRILVSGHCKQNCIKLSLFYYSYLLVCIGSVFYGRHLRQIDRTNFDDQVKYKFVVIWPCFFNHLRISIYLMYNTNASLVRSYVDILNGHGVTDRNDAAIKVYDCKCFVKVKIILLKIFKA